MDFIIPVNWVQVNLPRVEGSGLRETKLGGIDKVVRSCDVYRLHFDNILPKPTHILSAVTTAVVLWIMPPIVSALWDKSGSVPLGLEGGFYMETGNRL